MHSWNWQRWQGQPYLTCNLLSGWHHGFFTRHYAPQKPEWLVECWSDTQTVFRVKQVHGSTVLSTTAIASHPPAENDTLPEADGVISDRPQESVWVCSADCTPALIADVQTGQVAAVHAGWRGTAAKILPVAIAQFQGNGSNLANLRIALGPAIAGSVYQVDADVALQVVNTVHPLHHQSPLAMLETLYNTANSPVLPDATEGKARLDVRRVNMLQLEQLGIVAEQVAIAPYCTYQDPEHFFSYRRDQQKNVQWSGIVAKAEANMDSC